MAVWLNLRAIDESSRSLKAIINRVIISFRNKNAAFARFCNKIDDIYDKNTVFALKLVFQIKKASLFDLWAIFSVYSQCKSVNLFYR